MSVEDDVEPACEDLISGEDWRRATARDLQTDFDLCKYCFPNTDDINAIEEPTDHLVVCEGAWASHIHVHEDHGEPEYNTVEEQSTLAATLADPEFGPEDAGLSPLDGGEV